MAYNDLFNWMQPQADDYAHGQIDSEIDNNTLMDMVVGPQLLDIPSVDLAYQERTPEIRQTTPSDLTGVSEEDLLSMVMGGTSGIGGLAKAFKQKTIESAKSGFRVGQMSPTEIANRMTANIAGLFKRGGKGEAAQADKIRSGFERRWGQSAKQPGIMRPEEVINRTVATARGLRTAKGSIKAMPRENMMEKAQRFLIPSPRSGKVHVPGHTYYKSGEVERGFARHLEFPTNTFQSEKTLNKAIKNVQSRIAESKNKIRQWSSEGEKSLVNLRAQDLYVHQQKLDALLDFKRTPEKELVERLHKFIKDRPSGDVSWYDMGQRIYENTFGYTYSKGFTK